jgi:hypothetical protein
MSKRAYVYRNTVTGQQHVIVPGYGTVKTYGPDQWPLAAAFAEGYNEDAAEPQQLDAQALESLDGAVAMALDTFKRQIDHRARTGVPQHLQDVYREAALHALVNGAQGALEEEMAP